MPVWSRPFLFGRGTPIPCRIDVGMPELLGSSRRIGGSLSASIDPTSA
jgi:hypothetical protein